MESANNKLTFPAPKAGLPLKVEANFLKQRGREGFFERGSMIIIILCLTFIGIGILSSIGSLITIFFILFDNEKEDRHWKRN